MKKEYFVNGDKEREEYPIIRVFVAEEDEIYDVADLSCGELSLNKAWETADELILFLNEKNIKLKEGETK